MSNTEIDHVMLSNEPTDPGQYRTASRTIYTLLYIELVVFAQKIQNMVIFYPKKFAKIILG